MTKKNTPETNTAPAPWSGDSSEAHVDNLDSQPATESTLDTELDALLADRTPDDFDGIEMVDSLPDGTGGDLEDAVARIALQNREQAEQSGALTWRILLGVYMSALYAARDIHQVAGALDDVSFVVSAWQTDAQSRLIAAIAAEPEAAE